MMEIITVNLEDYPDINKFPKEGDYWNANIQEINQLNHVRVASCVSPILDILDIHMIIILKPNTTIDDIRNDWSRIKDVCNKTYQSYGKFNRTNLIYHQTAYRLHEDFNMGYGEIQQFLNLKILIYLCFGIGLVNEKGFSEDREVWINFFEKYLTSFGHTPEDAKDYCKDAIDVLSKGKFPWRFSEGPIRKAFVREKLRYFSTSVVGDQFSLNRRMDRLIDVCFFPQSWAYLLKLYNKTFKLNRRERNQIEKWEEIRKAITCDFMKNVHDFFPKPPGWEG